MINDKFRIIETNSIKIIEDIQLNVKLSNEMVVYLLNCFYKLVYQPLFPIFRLSKKIEPVLIEKRQLYTSTNIMSYSYAPISIEVAANELNKIFYVIYKAKKFFCK